MNGFAFTHTDTHTSIGFGFRFLLPFRSRPEHVKYTNDVRAIRMFWIYKVSDVHPFALNSAKNRGETTWHSGCMAFPLTLDRRWWSRWYTIHENNRIMLCEFFKFQWNICQTTLCSSHPLFITLMHIIFEFRHCCFALKAFPIQFSPMSNRIVSIVNGDKHMLCRIIRREWMRWR